MAKSPRALRYPTADAMPAGMRTLYEGQQQSAPTSPAQEPGWIPGGAKRASKYSAQPTIVGGIRFDSKAEARYYQGLQLRVAAGTVEFFMRQAPLHLPGNTRYVVDFLEFLPCQCGGCTCQRHRFVDVKGVQTQMFRMKKKQVEALYPIEIEIEK